MVAEEMQFGGFCFEMKFKLNLNGGKMKKSILLLSVLMLLPLISALTPAPNGECYKYEPIKLMKGWNLIAFQLNYTSFQYKCTSDCDRNISITAPRTLAGYSGENPLKLSDIYYTNSSGYKYEYSEWRSKGIINISVFRNTGTNIDSPTSGYLYNPKYIYPTEGFMVYSGVNGTLTLPGVGGTLSSEKYDYNNFRYSNGTNEYNWDDATGLYLLDPSFHFLNETRTSQPYVEVAIYVSGWRGYWLRSKVDLLYVLSNNETQPCKAKFPKISNNNALNTAKIFNFNTGGKPTRFNFYINHNMRLFGGTKSWETS